MGNFNTFKFTADTIDGKIQEFPQVFSLRCKLVKPIGESIVREFNGNECIVAMKVFLIMYEGQLLGNRCHKSFTGFMNFLRAQCFTDYLSLNGCNLQLDGCDLILN